MLLSFLEERDVARRGRDAREWLTHDERGRVVGLLIASVAMSIAMSIIVAAIVGVVSRRRAVTADEAAIEITGEPLAAVEAPAGVPVMDVVEPGPVEVSAEA
jgi:Zn-dependent protease with chaperone function